MLNFFKNLLQFTPKFFLLLGSFVGIALVPLSLPGTWIIWILAFIYSLLWNFSHAVSDFRVLAFLLLLALFGEGLEFLVSFWGGKKLQVSNGALWSSIVGGFIGAFIGVPVFLIGSLLGLLLGTFLGAFLYEYFQTKVLSSALLSALAVFFSRLVASFMKTSLAVIMWIYLYYKV